MTDRMSLLAIGGVAAAAFLTWTTPTLAQEARPSAELAGHALHQVAMTTSDLARATVFYRDVMGLPFQFEANGMAFFDVAGVRDAGRRSITDGGASDVDPLFRRARFR